MTKKIGDKKISGVTSTTETSGVQGTEGVTGIGGIRATSGIGGVGAAGGIGKRRATRLMTAAERQQLFHMIDEEAEKLAKEGIIPKRQQDTVSKAVRMAIDSGVLDDEEEE